MKNNLLFLIIVSLISCTGHPSKIDSSNIITEDIALFWNAYDQITSTKDSTQQYQLLEDLYLSKGSDGLKAMIKSRNYTSKDFLDAINHHPKFWASIRENTLKADQFSTSLNEGIEKLRAVYPHLKPAKMYFTIGALRSNGTTMDSLVLIGSELAMTDQNTITSEFTKERADGFRTFFDSNPIDGLVLLNVHEYVHTQQNPFIGNLLSQVIYEGIAEFVSVIAMDQPSNAPAVEFGKNNPKVREAFEKEMFNMNNQHEWLWSSAPNDFGVRDLGYYIGYEMAELNYNKSENKKEAIKKMIQLDHTDEKALEAFVDGSSFFSKPLNELYEDFDARRPEVIKIKQFDNGDTQVDPNIKNITFVFSEPLNGYNTGIDYGPLGKEAFPKMDFNRTWSDDNREWSIPLELEPNKKYQFLVSNNFRKEDGTPLRALMINFETKD